MEDICAGKLENRSTKAGFSAEWYKRILSLILRYGDEALGLTIIFIGFYLDYRGIATLDLLLETSLIILFMHTLDIPEIITNMRLGMKSNTPIIFFSVFIFLLLGGGYLIDRVNDLALNTFFFIWLMVSFVWPVIFFSGISERIPTDSGLKNLEYNLFEARGLLKGHDRIRAGITVFVLFSMLYMLIFLMLFSVNWENYGFYLLVLGWGAATVFREREEYNLFRVALGGFLEADRKTEEYWKSIFGYVHRPKGFLYGYSTILMTGSTAIAILASVYIFQVNMGRLALIFDSGELFRILRFTIGGAFMLIGFVGSAIYLLYANYSVVKGEFARDHIPRVPLPIILIPGLSLIRLYSNYSLVVPDSIIYSETGSTLMLYLTIVMGSILMFVLFGSLRLDIQNRIPKVLQIYVLILPYALVAPITYSTSGVQLLMMFVGFPIGLGLFTYMLFSSKREMKAIV